MFLLCCARAAIGQAAAAPPISLMNSRLAERDRNVRFVPKAEVAVIRSMELIVQPHASRRAADSANIAKLPELLSRRQTWGVR
jgi:hypothetical protein